MRKQGVTVVAAYEDDEFEIFSSPNETGTPDRKLLTAMLERAILDYVGNDQKEIDDASEWIFGEKDEGPLRAFSFPWVCQHLDLDAHHIAKLIEAMPKRGSRKIAPWYFKNTQANNKLTPEKKVGEHGVNKAIVTLVSHNKTKASKQRHELTAQDSTHETRHLALVG